MNEEELELMLNEYYRKRRVIESCFGYKYSGTVGSRVDNLTKKSATSLKEKIHG